MSKTYIVETDDETQLIVEIGVNSTGAAVITTHHASFLTPYTEPDTEKVREEAYEDGYKTAKVQCNIQAEKDLREVGERHYQKGLNDAWEAARKIVLSTEDGGLFDYEARKAVFGCGNYMALKKYTVSEAIEKIRKYEQEQEEKQHTWIFSEVNEPSVDTTLICSKCGYTITIKPGDTQALNFCPKCGDNKNPKEEEA